MCLLMEMENTAPKLRLSGLHVERRQQVQSQVYLTISADFALEGVCRKKRLKWVGPP